MCMTYKIKKYPVIINLSYKQELLKIEYTCLFKAELVKIFKL